MQRISRKREKREVGIRYTRRTELSFISSQKSSQAASSGCLLKSPVKILCNTRRTNAAQNAEAIAVSA
jgi:hypothetical protein